MTLDLRTRTNDRPAVGDRTADRYIDLLCRAVANTIYQDPEVGEEVHDANKRHNGVDFPSLAHTMVGTRRLENLRSCMEMALDDNVPGDVIECGVWRGGASILMRGILAAYQVTDRLVWVADSFQGMPQPVHQADRGYSFSEALAVPLETVQENFRRYGLLDGQVRFLPGWFADTLPTIPDEQRFAVIRLDGDLYQSTMDALEHLYPKLSRGGYCIIDDYGAVRACAQAVRDYRIQHQILDAVQRVDWTGAFWRKST